MGDVLGTKYSACRFWKPLGLYVQFDVCCFGAGAAGGVHNAGGAEGPGATHGVPGAGGCQQLLH